MSTKTKLGYAEISAFAGVNDNGEAVVTGPIVTVNSKMTAPNLKHQSRIFGKRYEVTEVEDGEAYTEGGRMVSYTKQISGVQKDMDGKTSGQVNTPNEYRQETPQNNAARDLKPGELSGMQVLKNFVDRIHANSVMQWVVIAIVAIVGALALGLALTK